MELENKQYQKKTYISQEIPTPIISNWKLREKTKKNWEKWIIEKSSKPY